MTHPPLVRPLAFTLGALLLAGCGSQAPVQLDVAPAATPGDHEPIAEDRAVEETVAEEIVAPEEAEADAPVTDAQEPSVGTSARPSPLTPDPELIVDEDGCATDVATGIVVACHDPAAGPDDD